MKTPRGILLSRHRLAESRLDAVREQALATLEQRPGSHRDVLGILRQLFTVPRPVWGAFAAAWIIIVALNLVSQDRSARQPGALASGNPGAVEALAEQRRFYAELVRSVMPADVPPYVPRPRSECRNSIAAA